MRCVANVSLKSIFAAGTIALAACVGNPSSSPWVGPPSANPEAARRLLGRLTSGSGKIQHVVILVQENRSFNHLFMGYPGATTQNYGYISSGKKVSLKEVSLKANFIPGYGLGGVLHTVQRDGQHSRHQLPDERLRQSARQCGNNGCPIRYPPYSFVKRSEIKPYWDLAKQYVLADRMYSSNIDASSFVSHQYIIAAQAMQSYNWPYTKYWGCEGPAGNKINVLGPQRQHQGTELVCFNDLTLGQEADDAGVTWAAYSAPVGPGNGGGWNGYQANRHVYYGSDWDNDIIQSPSQFLTDVSDGKLRQITWITPARENSDHPQTFSKTGPMWVASLVNTIGQSQFWDSTAIFIFWDDPSGFFDPAPPPYVDYDGLGFRLPLLIISPYAKKGYVTHVQYEHGSILKFTEDMFGLPRLSAS